MIAKSEKLTKQQLIKNLQNAKIDKVEVFEGFRSAMEVKANIERFGSGVGVSIIMIREK